MKKSFNILTKLAVGEVSSVDEPANRRHFALRKGRDHQPNSMEENVEEENKAPEVESVEKADEVVEQVEERNESVEALAKAREEYAAIAKEREALAKELADAKQALAKELDEKLTAQYVSKAEASFKNIAKSEDEVQGLGLLLKSLNGLDSDVASKVEAILAKCEEELAARDAAIEGGELLEEVGKAGEPEQVSPMEEATRLAKEKYPELSESQGRAQIWVENPELYARAQKG